MLLGSKNWGTKLLLLANLSSTCNRITFPCYWLLSGGDGSGAPITGRQMALSYHVTGESNDYLVLLLLLACLLEQASSINCIRSRNIYFAISLFQIYIFTFRNKVLDLT